MDRVVLIGLSGTGKSTVARQLAEALSFDCVDLDDDVVTTFGCPISEIFSRFGEPVFRSAERASLIRSCSRDRCVVATGGGVVVDERNWVTMRPNSLIVHLIATEDEILARLQQQVKTDPAAGRPMIGSADQRASLSSLAATRKHLYARADCVVVTSGKTTNEVAEEIARIAREAESGELALPIGSIGAAHGRSDLYVDAGLLEHAGSVIRQRFPEARRAWLITDNNVGPLWAAHVAQNIERVGIVTETLEVPAGESSKSLDQVAQLLDQVLSARLDRRDLVVALGGGVVGDLAGFVAAIALRGVGLIQVPTSLLAMVDSSVGGKTGVNHERGKNLIGAFYQPQLVLADPTVLETLPEREWRGGWAEIAKHAMIEGSATGSTGADLMSLIEHARDEQLRDPAFMTDVVRRNVLIKTSVVLQDERETGLRRVLNYGHTLGHAMEASGYRYHHGEAVALGMRAAADIALRLGRTSSDVVDRQNLLLDRIGLPSRFEGDLRDVIERLGSDKKAVHGALTWILPSEIVGAVEIVSGVPMEVVEATAAGLGARS